MGVFGVWYGKCAKYLAFGTFATAAVDALIFLLPLPKNKIHFSLSFYVTFQSFLLCYKIIVNVTKLLVWQMCQIINCCRL